MFETETLVWFVWTLFDLEIEVCVCGGGGGGVRGSIAPMAPQRLRPWAVQSATYNYTEN